MVVVVELVVVVSATVVCAAVSIRAAERAAAMVVRRVRMRVPLLVEEGPEIGMIPRPASRRAPGSDQDPGEEAPSRMPPSWQDESYPNLLTLALAEATGL